MNENDYSKRIEKLGLTQVGAAEFLNINERTSRRYVGGSPPSRAVDLLLAIMVKHKITAEQALRLIRK